MNGPHTVTDRRLNHAAEAIVRTTDGGPAAILASHWTNVEGGPVWIVCSYADPQPAAPFCVVISVWENDDADEPAPLIVSRHATLEEAIAHAAEIAWDGITPAEIGGAE
jgi:hypothetical protein